MRARWCGRWLSLLGPLATAGAAGCSSDSGYAGPGMTQPAGLCAAQAAAGLPIRLSKDAAGLVSQHASGAVTPAVAAGTDGSRLIVYRDDIPTGSGEIVVRRAERGDGAFGPPQVVSGTRAESAAPDVALAGDVAIVVWVEVDGEAQGLYARVSSDAGQTFQPPMRLSTDAGSATRPRVAIDAAGRIVVLWDGAALPNEASPFRERSLRLARSDDGGRSFVEAPVLAEIQGLGQPALAVAPSGRVFAMWAEQASFEGGQALMLVRSNPDDTSFSPPTNVAAEVTAGAALAVDAQGALLLLWMPGTTTRGFWEPLGVGLLRSTDDGATFTDLGTLDAAPATGVWLAADAGGVAMVWTSCPSAPACTSRLSRSTDGGVTRSPPADLTRTAPGGSPLVLAAVGSAAPAMLLVWDRRSGWFHDLSFEKYDPANPVAEISPLTAHGDLSSAAIGAAASAPVVALPGGGRIITAWSQEANVVPSDDAGIFFTQSADDGRSFSPPLRVADNLPNVDFACRRADPDVRLSESLARVSVATRGTRDIALAWSDDVVDPAWQGACWLAARPDVFVSRSSDGGLTFSPPVNVSRSAGPSEDPVLAYDARGALTVVWEERVDERLAGCSYAARTQILAARSQDGSGTFSAPAHISEQARPGYCGNTFNPVLSAAGDSLHAGWIAQSSNDVGNTEVVVARSGDGGASFSPARSVIALPYADGMVSALAARAPAAGELWLAWKIDDAVWVAQTRDGGQSFASPVRIGGSAASDGIGFDVAAGAAGGGWVAWAGAGAAGSGREVQLAALASDGAPVATHDLSNNIGDSDWPDVAADGAGNALVAWQDDTLSPGTPGILITCQPAASR